MATAKKKVETVDSVTEKTVAETTPKKATQTKKQYSAEEPIPCRSVTYGKLICVGPKSKLNYEWADYGDITEVEYQDLRALQSTHSGFLTKPLFVIEDDELVKQWSSSLKAVYDRIASLDVDSLFKMTPSQFKKKLESFPVSYRQTVVEMANKMILTGELDSLAKIKAIDEVCGTDLTFAMQ